MNRRDYLKGLEFGLGTLGRASSFLARRFTVARKIDGGANHSHLEHPAYWEPLRRRMETAVRP